MGIRSAAKAILLNNHKVLLNRCFQPALGEYYTLPGGGQRQYETMEDAVIRECLEETGYSVVPESFVALYEEIHTSDEIRTHYPEYAHKIFHIFRCSLAGDTRQTPTERDTWQSDCVWVDVGELPAVHLMPVSIHNHILQLLQTKTPLYLGTRYIDIGETV